MKGDEHDFDTPELKRAHMAVEASRNRLEESFNKLEDKLKFESSHIQDAIDSGTERFKSVYDTLTAPKRFAENNPFASVAFFVVAGFFVGTMIARAGSRPRPHTLREDFEEFGRPISPFPPEEPSRGLEAENIGASTMPRRTDQA